MLNKPRTLYLFLVTILMVIFFTLRVNNIQLFPLFIDETLAIQRAEATRMGDPLFFAGQGKVLLPWIASVFLTSGSEIFVIRYVTILIVMIGIASTTRIAQIVSGWHAAMITIVLVAFNPMLHFHDRLAINDSILHPLLTLFTLSLLLGFGKDSPKWWLFVTAGCVFVGSLLAKATALVMIPLPFVSMVLLARRWAIRQRLIAMLVVYGTICILWIPFYSFALARGVDYFGRATEGSSGVLLSWQHITTNLQLMWTGYDGYLGLLAIILLVGSLCAVLYHLHEALFLLSFALGFNIALVIVGDVLFYRYWVVTLPVFSALLAIALTAIPVRSVRKTVIAVVLLVFGFNGLLFALQVNNDPLTASLPTGDYGQYLYNDSAGTGLREVATILENLSAPTVGAFVGCDSLQYYVSASVDLTCVSLSATESERISRLRSVIDATDYTYIILEMPGYIEQSRVDVAGEIVYQIDRPGGVSQITVYQVIP